MFSGLSFLLSGNMVCGILDEDLVVGIGKEHYEQALRQPHTKIFDLTGRTMRGWVTVGPEGCAEDGALRVWLRLGIE